MIYRIFKRMSSARIIAAGYAVIILIGALLFMLPISAKGQPATPMEALFTAVSSTCITGFVLADNFVRWSTFGHVVMLLLIQIGGLGFMTMICLAARAMGKRFGLKESLVLQDSLTNPDLGGIVLLAGHIAAGTAIFEFMGAVIFMTRLIPEMGVAQGIWNSIFFSVSAFCNAGIDLFDRYGEYSSLTHSADDPVLLMTAAVLMTVGGIGFAVWNDMLEHGFHLRRYSLHSKLVLYITAFLTVTGTVLYFLFEQNFTIRDMPLSQQLYISVFNSVMPRTGGFNCVDFNQMSPASKVLTLMYMFIGGSPGSTAGGVKTTTFAIMLLSAWAGFRNRSEVDVLGRRLESDAPMKALAVIVINLFLAIIAVITLNAIQPELGTFGVMLEVFSAITTCGISSGATRHLSFPAQIMIMLLMYCGRVGSVTFALVFTRSPVKTGIHNPSEPVSIG
ncbi:MAG: Trk family potassium uptake protein [Oscillospiraceae bacterium]|nr:Trk family potassium uptake protein [Oscillospiraceae bacterium]